MLRVPHWGACFSRTTESSDQENLLPASKPLPGCSLLPLDATHLLNVIDAILPVLLLQ